MSLEYSSETNSQVNEELNSVNSRKKYHTRTDTPVFYQGRLAELVGCDRSILIVTRIFSLQEKIGFRPVYSTYKKFATYTLNALNMSERTMWTYLNRLVKKGIIIKHETPKELKKDHGICVRDNTLCWSLNYEYLEKFGIDIKYLKRVIYADKRIVVKNTLKEKICETLKEPPLNYQLISNYIDPPKIDLVTCQSKNNVFVRKEKMQTSFFVEQVQPDDQFRHILERSGYHPNRFPWEFEHWRKWNSEKGLKKASLDAFHKSFATWCKNGALKGNHLSGYKSDFNSTKKEVGHVVHGERGRCTAVIQQDEKKKACLDEARFQTPLYYELHAKWIKAFMDCKDDLAEQYRSEMRMEFEREKVSQLGETIPMGII